MGKATRDPRPPPPPPPPPHTTTPPPPPPPPYRTVNKANDTTRKPCAFLFYFFGGAELKIMSAVEAKEPGYFTRNVEEKTSSQVSAACMCLCACARAAGCRVRRFFFSIHHPVLSVMAILWYMVAMYPVPCT